MTTASVLQWRTSSRARCIAAKFSTLSRTGSVSTWLHPMTKFTTCATSTSRKSPISKCSFLSPHCISQVTLTVRVPRGDTTPLDRLRSWCSTGDRSASASAMQWCFSVWRIMKTKQNNTFCLVVLYNEHDVYENLNEWRHISTSNRCAMMCS